MTAPTIATRVMMTIAGFDRVARCDLHWYDIAPFEVRMTVRDGSSAIPWFLARSLLVEGLIGEAGIGDVQVRPDGDMVEIELRTPDGRGVLIAHRGDIEAFLEQTEAVQPDDDLEVSDAVWEKWLEALA